MKHHQVLADSDGEPVDNLDNRDKADSKAETAKPSKAGDEVKPRHLGGALKLCKIEDQFCHRGHNVLPNTAESPKKRLTTAMSLSYALYLGSPCKKRT